MHYKGTGGGEVSVKYTPLSKIRSGDTLKKYLIDPNRVEYLVIYLWLTAPYYLITLSVLK